MAERETYEMISAFSAGCMDRDNFINFKNYMLKGNNLPYRELGELQNVVALLPILLETELPSEEIKARILSKTVSLENINSGNPDSPVTVPEPEISDTKEEPIDLKNIPDEIKDEEIETQQLSFTKITADESHSTNTTKESFLKKSLFKSDKFLMFLVPSVLMLLMLVVMLIITSSQTTRINELENKLTGMLAENNQIKEYIKDNSIFVEFFNYKDIISMQLSGGPANPDRSGKIFIAQSNDEALLDLANIPAISDDEVYQVWLYIKEDTFSLGTFKPESGKRYYRLTDINKFDADRLTKIEITSETFPESIVPEGEVFYSSGL